MMLKELLEKIKGVLRGRLDNSEGPSLPKVKIDGQIELKKVRIIRADGTIEEMEL